jgi:GWxTD domain-containing protein
LDAYLAIPFQAISFIKASNGEYYSKYEILITCFDFTGNPVAEKKMEKVAKASTFEMSQGTNADFDLSIISLFLEEGSYKVKVEVVDRLSRVIYDRTREVSVINFRKFPFALSGVMLVSSIFESEGDMSITPFLDDNISNLEDGFFVFFETYNQKEGDSVDFVYQILEDKKVLEESPKITKYIATGSSQEYIKIKKPTNLSSGSFILKIIALAHLEDAVIEESKYLAITQRTISYVPSFAGNIIDNLDLAIKQLRYVATNSQITYINEAKNNEDKMKKFKEFWDLLDPTPNTQRNEAFDDYYSRIAYANEKFKSYSQGWQTDMGMVYVIFGPPNQVDRRQDYYNPSRYYEKWSYLNNREFVFVDQNGFGDYRLTNSSMISEKYEYKRN